MSNRKIYRSIGVGAILFFLFLLPDPVINKIIVEEGYLVKAEIASMPSCCECKTTYPVFRYKGKEFSKKAWEGFCSQYKLGDSILFFKSDKFPDRLVFEIHKKIYVNSELISTLLLVFASIALIVYSYIYKDEV